MAISRTSQFLVIYVLAASVCMYDCARILGVFHTPTHSHFAGPSVLLKELAARGHDVTVLTPYPLKSPVKNLRHIELTGFLDESKGPQLNLFDFENINFLLCEFMFGKMLLGTTEKVLEHENVQQLLKSDQTFDLVLMEDFASHALKGFAYHFNAPCIMVHSLGLSRLASPQVGNPYFPAYMPDFFLPYSKDMSFFQRLHNSFAYLFSQLFHHLYVLPGHNEVLHKYFPGAPHINDLFYNASMTFLNSHVSTHPAVPYVPNMIDIGGIHVKPPKPLPRDLQEYLDGAKDGAIFFSMGSNLKSSKFPVEKREAILKAFTQLKQRVLWKWEDENLPGKSPNVKIGKWLPQSDVLAHPNVKLFITHGGLLSQIETVYHGVPIVGLPIFADQKMNMANAEVNGIGLSLPYSQLTAESFLAVIEEALTNPKYQENIKIRSKIMHDQPMKPIDKAIFWIEYVLRHKGAPHLRTAALNLTWYQYLLLDVILFLVTVSAAVVVLVRFIFKRLFFSREKPKSVSKNKKTN